MLKIVKIKEEILNFNHANDALRCYLARVTTKQSNIDGCCRPNLRCEECLKVSFIDLLEEYKKPEKLNSTWFSSCDYVGMFKSTFSFVKWEDEEPCSIDEILANCEVMQDEKS